MLNAVHSTTIHPFVTIKQATEDEIVIQVG